MRLGDFLALPVVLAVAVHASTTSVSGHEYSEHLHLKPLPGGALYAGFNFTASTPLNAYDDQHFQFFPRSLAQILQFTRTAELHIRFALGRWDEENWGSRPKNGWTEGGTGVELWAWLEADTQTEAEEQWDGLVNSLSGLFCASLNFIDQSKTTQPILSFAPQGTLRHQRPHRQLMHGMLPNEVVCTENLTPFLKLLPCKGKAGISSLLDGHKVFDANWQTMAIDVRPVCSSTNKCQLEIQQSVDMVLDIERGMRPRDDPIPRPLPIERIQCNTSKPYNSGDACYPAKLDGQPEWSLSRIFGRPIQGSCPIKSNSADISVEVPTSSKIEASGVATVELSNADSLMRKYALTENNAADVGMSHQPVDPDFKNDRPSLHASRQITGYGQERGGMHTTLRNPLPHAQRVVFLESLPWFLRPYMHTLAISGATLEKMYYTPAIDRRRGTRLELVLDIPAETTVDLAYDFEKAILRYTEYPPDANRGFDIAPAIIRVLSSTNGTDGQDSYLRTTSLLLPLPTPDFSMPYNVIILTSTVIALGFGSIFNLLIRRFILLREVPTSPAEGFIKNAVARVKALTSRSESKEAQVATTPSEIVHKGTNGIETQTTGLQIDETLNTTTSRRVTSNKTQTHGGANGHTKT